MMEFKATRKEMCKTCIFRHDGVSVSSARNAEIRKYLLNGTSHICHTGMDDQPMACRGGRNYQLTMWHRMGLIQSPTDEALAETMQDLGLAPPK